MTEKLYENKEPESVAIKNAWTLIGWGTGSIGVISIFLFPFFQAQNVYQGLEIIAVMGVTSGAAFATGGLLGFIFGIPRSQAQEKNGASPKEDTPGATNNQNDKFCYHANTNLEQISDWLTKILVGVGLVEINKISAAFTKFAGLFKFDNLQINEAFPCALLVLFMISGFLSGYLWTRLYFASALKLADGHTLANRIDQIEIQGQNDAKAFIIVQKLLDPDSSSTIPQEEINKVISQASSGTRARIYYMAQKQRKDYWRQPDTKPKMAQAIPIFRALIASDTMNQYYENHAQLGFALKDLLEPNWKEAEAELSKAIDIRGSLNDKQYMKVIYEFNRAICNINLDADYNKGQPSTNKQRKIILDDLKAASKASYLLNVMTASSDVTGEPSISKWMQLNNIDLNQIK